MKIELSNGEKKTILKCLFVALDSEMLKTSYKQEMRSFSEIERIEKLIRKVDELKG